MKKVKKEELAPTVVLYCKLCSSNYRIKIDETKLIDPPCGCNIQIDMYGYEGLYGDKYIEVFQTVTKELGSFNRLTSISNADMVIA